MYIKTVDGQYANFVALNILAIMRKTLKSLSSGGLI